eukprot:g4831.t1
MSDTSKMQNAISIEAHSQANVRDTIARVTEAQITINPPKSSEDLKSVDSTTNKKEVEENKKPRVAPQEPLEQTFFRRIGRIFEKVWIWAFTLTLVLSLLLSISALSGESSYWLKSRSENDESRVGWRLGCAEHKDPSFRPNPKSTMHQYVLVQCGPGDPASSLDSVLNETSAYLGYSIFAVIVGAWLLAVLVVICSNYIPRVQGTCCHGFSVSGVWFVTGIALFALTVSFRYAVNNHLEAHFEMRYSVTCRKYDRETSLCSNVPSLDTCASKCRIINQGRIVCAGYQSCRLDKRRTSCDEDNIGCALDPSWAFYCSIGSAISFLFMALILAFGSVSVSKDL